MHVSLMICINLSISYTRCHGVIEGELTDGIEAVDRATQSVAGLNLYGMMFDEEKNASVCVLPGGSLDRETYSRSEEWSLPVIGAIGYEAFIVFGAMHIVLTVLRAYSFIMIRFPVLDELYTRNARLGYLNGTHVDGAEDRKTFIRDSVLVYGLPYVHGP